MCKGLNRSIWVVYWLICLIVALDWAWSSMQEDELEWGVPNELNEKLASRDELVARVKETNAAGQLAYNELAAVCKRRPPVMKPCELRLSRSENRQLLKKVAHSLTVQQKIEQSKRQQFEEAKENEVLALEELMELDAWNSLGSRGITPLKLWPITAREQELMYELLMSDEQTNLKSKASQGLSQCFWVYKTSWLAERFDLASRKPQKAYTIRLDSQWSEHAMKELLAALKKFGRIEMRIQSIVLNHPQLFFVLAVLCQCLTIIEPPAGYTNHKLSIIISPESLMVGPAHLSLEEAHLQEDFRTQLVAADKAQHIIIKLTLARLTASTQTTILPLLTHFTIASLTITRPVIEKIDFINQVNWTDNYKLILEIDKPNTHIILPLPPRNKITGQRLICAHLSIVTIPIKITKDPSSIHYVPTTITGLSNYFQPGISKQDNFSLITKPTRFVSYNASIPIIPNPKIPASLKQLTLSLDILIFYATFDLNQTVYLPKLNLVDVSLKISSHLTHAIQAQLLASPRGLSLICSNPSTKKGAAQCYIKPNKITISFEQEAQRNPSITPSASKVLACFPYLVPNEHYTHEDSDSSTSDSQSDPIGLDPNRPNIPPCPTIINMSDSSDSDISPPNTSPCSFY
ncbi:hypothetical protein NEHOM01_1220 [Nematocida homosporus]|uniref:uncharacterized protein n=1 Tax=Nematocida homosporus TaxID=1912981 RepID=UPI00221FB131|nr:uncharacterized protein NEHOM01_1220 [Nematocida homosporus]KAI5186017.1 hypothetical protein NEHOM01_1220 [Nematocida homosporus]